MAPETATGTSCAAAVALGVTDHLGDMKGPASLRGCRPRLPPQLAASPYRGSYHGGRAVGAEAERRAPSGGPCSLSATW